MKTDDIKTAFKSGDIEYIDAIEQLTSRGMDPQDAEALVIAWEEETAPVTNEKLK